MVEKIKVLINNLGKKFWIRIFLRIGAVFVAFVIALAVCNSVFLSGYYESVTKNRLQSSGKKLKNLNLEDKTATTEIISGLDVEFGFEVEIYNSSGKTLYSSLGGQMMDYFIQDNRHLNMNHRPLDILKTEKLSDGSRFLITVDRRSDEEYIVYQTDLGDGDTAEIRVQRSLIKNSAEIANEILCVIAFVIFILAIFLVFWFSRKVAKPISDMNKITRKMADLDFSQTLTPTSEDEIGQLGISINALSGRLDSTLKDLKETNSKLRDEIELEHQMDVMRKGFVANVSHELKTPISIIQGYAEGLKLDINKASKDKYCDIIIDESQRMNKLVLSLLDLSKYESGQAQLQKESFDLAALSRGMAERLLGAKGVRVVLKMPEKAFAYGDSVQIEQCIKSYLENAKSHLNEGGEVEISITEEGDKYILTVYNSGSFVDPEIMPQIWQSFFRGDKSHKRENNRFGLGLSIVSAIIRLHNENCGVYNTENGVCFWFTVAKS